MLAVALWFGLIWPQVAPLAIVPGMTKEQVEAILGEERVGSFVFIGSVNSDGPEHERCTYRGGTLTVDYKRGKVESIDHHRK
jgi:hypothetical protein